MCFRKRLEEEAVVCIGDRCHSAISKWPCFFIAQHDTNPKLAAWPIKHFSIGSVNWRLGTTLSLDGNFTALPLRNSDFAGSCLFSLLGRRRLHLCDSRACMYLLFSQQSANSESKSLRLTLFIKGVREEIHLLLRVTIVLLMHSLDKNKSAGCRRNLKWNFYSNFFFTLRMREWFTSPVLRALSISMAGQVTHSCRPQDDKAWHDRVVRGTLKMGVHCARSMSNRRNFKVRVYLAAPSIS